MMSDDPIHNGKPLAKARPFYESDEVIGYLGAEFSEIEGFFHYLMNLSDTKVSISAQPISKRVVSSDITAKMWGKFLKIEGANNRRLASVISMAEWPERTPSKMLDDFLTVPAEFILTQSFAFVDRIAADAELKRQMRQMKANDDLQSRIEVEQAFITAEQAKVQAINLNLEGQMQNADNQATQMNQRHLRNIMNAK